MGKGGQVPVWAFTEALYTGLIVESPSIDSPLLHNSPPEAPVDKNTFEVHQLYVDVDMGDMVKSLGHRRRLESSAFIHSWCRYSSYTQHEGLRRDGIN